MLRSVLPRLLGAAAAGLALAAAFPPLGLWWLAPLALALVLGVVEGRRVRGALGYGAVFALAFQYPLLSWTGTYVGDVWLFLLAFLTLVVAVPVALMALVGRLPWAPLWQAAVWVAGEAVIERAPWGGFPWAKVAFSQAGGVFAPLASLGGAPLVSAATVLSGAGIWALVRAGTGLPVRAPARRRGDPAVPRAPRRGRGAAVGLVAVLVGPLAALATLPSVRSDPPAERTITVAAVQGNVPRAGLDFNAQRRAVLDNHVRETARLADAVRAGTVARPDLVIWPENSSDIDPFRNADAGAEIQAAADGIGVPVVVGAVLVGVRGPDGRIVQGPRNVAVVWSPGSGAGAGGPGPMYTKRHLLPFGEYIPIRSLARVFAGADVDRVVDFSPGSGLGVLPAGPARLGVATCYEVAFDDAVRDTVLGGADLLTVPTNNATFGFTSMTYQQQAMSRLRAVEHDRAVVIAATSGQSAIIAPDGSVVTRTGALFTPGVSVAPVPLRTGTTLATRLGPAPELVLAAVGGAAVVAALVAARAGLRRSPAR